MNLKKTKPDRAKLFAFLESAAKIASETANSFETLKNLLTSVIN